MCDLRGCGYVLSEGNVSEGAREVVDDVVFQRVGNSLDV